MNNKIEIRRIEKNKHNYLCRKCKNKITEHYLIFFNIDRPDEYFLELCSNCFQLNKLNFYKNYKVEKYG